MGSERFHLFTIFRQFLQRGGTPAAVYLNGNKEAKKKNKKRKA